MAGDDEGDGIAGLHSTHGARRQRLAHRGRNVAIRGGLAVRHRHHRFAHGDLEGGHVAPIDAHFETGALAAQELAELREDASDLAGRINQAGLAAGQDVLTEAGFVDSVAGRPNAEAAGSRPQRAQRRSGARAVVDGGEGGGFQKRIKAMQNIDSGGFFASSLNPWVFLLAQNDIIKGKCRCGLR